jgi:putative phosphoesterase
MTRIGLLSDTHTFFHPEIPVFFKDVDQIWHAGDIGNLETLQKLESFRPVKTVFGNIDGHDVRLHSKEFQLFECEQFKVLILHIGGYPGRYTPQALQLIREHKPGIFISGHSHILKVIYDKKYSLLHINPGAAGKSGWHQVITLLRFTLDNDQIKDMEIRELERNGPSGY